MIGKNFPKAWYNGRIRTGFDLMKYASPLCKCLYMPEFEIHDDNWVLYCEGCDKVME